MFEEYRKELKVIFNNIGALVSLVLVRAVVDLQVTGIQFIIICLFHIKIYFLHPVFIVEI